MWVIIWFSISRFFYIQGCGSSGATYVIVNVKNHDAAKTGARTHTHARETTKFNCCHLILIFYLFAPLSVVGEGASKHHMMPVSVMCALASGRRVQLDCEMFVNHRLLHWSIHLQEPPQQCDQILHVISPNFHFCWHNTPVYFRDARLYWHIIGFGR